MSRFHSITVFIVFLCAAQINCAADWPAFLGPSANGISPEKLILKNWNKKSPTLLWKVDLTDIGISGPSVADSKVFIIDHKDNNDIVRALDLRTGIEIWRYAYADTHVPNCGYARATPVIDGARVYTLSRLGLLHCLDIHTGAMLWTRNIITDFAGRRPEWDLSMSPIIDKEKIILCPGGANAAVVALNKITGATLWKGGGSDEAGYATPVLATINMRRQYVIFTAKAVMGVDRETGKKLWSYPWKTNCGVNAATPIVLGDSVFITTAYGQGSDLFAITQHHPKQIWHKKEVESRFSTPIFADGYLYTTTVSNHLMCINAQTGEIKWRQPGFESGAIVGIDGMLIVGDGRTGDYVLIKMTPASFQSFGHINPLGGQSWTEPIIADGKLIVRNTKALACLALN